MIDPILERAKLALDRLSNDPVAREEAFKREMDLGDLEYHRQREIAEARSEGRELGFELGREEALRAMIEQVAKSFGLPWDVARTEAVRASSAAELLALNEFLLAHRRWPEL